MFCWEQIVLRAVPSLACFRLRIKDHQIDFYGESQDFNEFTVRNFPHNIYVTTADEFIVSDCH